VEILDWRSRLERRLAAPASVANPSPVVRLAGRFADRVAARRAARRPAPPAGVCVVALGNLRVGGTGKTPATIALARDLAARGIRGAVLTRGYGAAAGPLVVRPEDVGAGDEARLVAGRLADHGWLVVQARRRAAGLAELLGRRPRPDVVVLDDGFQTAGVGRHLDVLILDSWAATASGVEARAGAVLPWGPYRETARGADRAHVWLLETAVVPPAAAGRPVVTGFTRSFALAVAAGADGPSGPQVYGLVCGLARPEGFEAAARRLLDGEPRVALRCPDHCRYDRSLVGRIVGAGRRRGVTAWVTTQKDWVKLAPVWPAGVGAQVVQLDVDWQGAPTLPDLVGERLMVLGAGGPEA